MQVMGNRPETWARYYDLKKYVREGQDALLGMKAWRESMEALLISSAEDAADELEEPEPAMLSDSDVEAGGCDHIVIELSSSSDEEEPDVNELEV